MCTVWLPLEAVSFRLLLFVCIQNVYLCVPMECATSRWVCASVLTDSLEWIATTALVQCSEVSVLRCIGLCIHPSGFGGCHVS